MQVDDVAELAMLPLVVYAVGISHLAPCEVLEPLVAVEASTVLAELREPRPHLFDWCIDGHRVQDLRPVLGEEFIAWEPALLVPLAWLPSAGARA